MEVVALLSRLLHILASMAAVGGPMFVLLALSPAMRGLADRDRATLQDAIRRRWSKVVMAAILFLTLTGLYNFFAFRAASGHWGEVWQSGSANSKLYNMLFGVKFLLALAIFFVASALSGRSAGLAKFRENAKTWLTVQLVLAVLVVAIAGQMRFMHVGPNGPPVANPSTANIEAR